MKSLMAMALMIVSVSAFTAEPGSVDSFLSILPLGQYSGQDDAGNACSVTVVESNFPSKSLTVTAQNDKTKVFKVINDGSDFLFRAHKEEFIQTDRYYVDSTRNSFVERVIRTVKADNGLYVIVANETTVNRDLSIEAVECVVKK